MRDVADGRDRVAASVEQGFEACLALGKRKGPKVLAGIEQKIEGEEHEVVGLAVRQRRLQGCEIGRARGIERHYLAVDHGIGQVGGGVPDRAEALGPVEALAGLQQGLPARHRELHAVAVELDLVHPAGAGRRSLDRPAELRRDEIRARGRGLGCIGPLGLGGRKLLGFRGRWLLRLRGRGRLDGRRLRGRLRGGSRLRHEGAWLASSAGRDVVHGAGRGDRSVVFEQGLTQAFPRLLVLVLDQEPVHPLAAGAVMLHADQDPAALELVTLQGELEVAVEQSLLGRGLLRLPRAPVPDHDGAAAVLSFRDRSFEIAVVERVVFDLDREPLVGRIGRGSPVSRPRT